MACVTFSRKSEDISRRSNLPYVYHEARLPLTALAMDMQLFDECIPAEYAELVGSMRLATAVLVEIMNNVSALHCIL